MKLLFCCGGTRVRERPTVLAAATWPSWDLLGGLVLESSVKPPTSPDLLAVLRPLNKSLSA